ncbi:MAG: hypothetical protein SF162_16995 [bacterium]|nr:hypothetical protein [bacterium]
MTSLAYHDEVSRTLSQAVYHAHVNLMNMNGLLRITIQNGMWRKRFEGITGQIVEFETFEEYVTAQPPYGLGSDIKTLKLLCLGDEELIKLLEHASFIQPTKLELTHRSEKPLKPKRFSKEWTIDRLIDEDRFDLLKELTSGKSTPYAIQVAMGWRKREKKDKNTASAA